MQQHRPRTTRTRIVPAALRGAALLALVAMVGACDTDQVTRPPEADVIEPLGPSGFAAAVEGHFFFYPPLGLPRTNGDFNPNLATHVEICEWDRAAANDDDPDTDPCLDVLESFGPSEIQVKERRGFYRVRWSLRNTDGIQLGTLYAIRVLASGVTIGSKEIVIGRNGRQARRAARSFGGGVLPLNKNRTLPIKYRIEYGIFCEGDCAEATVSNDEGGTVTTQGEDVGATFAPGSFPDTLEDVTVIIEEVDVDPGECLGDLGVLTTSGRCIHFSTEPELEGGFEEPVVVGICPDDSDVPSGIDPEHFKIHHFDPDTPGQGIEELPGAAAPFLDCSGYNIAQLDRGPISRLAHAGFQAIKRLVGPAPLAARDEGFGGVTSRFSDFQWALPIEVVAVSSTSLTGTAGSTLDDPVVVQVLTAHNHSGAPQAPVPNQTVTFTFFDVAGAGAGAREIAAFAVVAVSDTIGTATAQTDSNGYASVPWTLTNNLGTQTVEATAFNSSTVVFSADAVSALAMTSTGIGSEGLTAEDGRASGDGQWSDRRDGALASTRPERFWNGYATATAVTGMDMAPYARAWYDASNGQER